MAVFDCSDFDQHELVTFARDAESGLSAIIAVHNTSRGPALGGCRMWPYASETEALRDVLRLSRGMTYKAALAGLNFGGGKSVILGDPARDKSPALFHALGRAVDSLGGRYKVAEDVGITVADVARMAETTPHVAGLAAGADSGDPSPATAYGVHMGIKAAVKYKFGQDSLRGIRVAVQGAGAVGAKLCRHLAAEGAEVSVADTDAGRARALADSLDLHAVPAGEILDVAAEVLAPCALGAVIDDASLRRLRVGIVAGAANNQLAEDRHGAALHARGILYAPDYVINAGGIIHISHEGPNYDRARAYTHVARIHDTLLAIFARAEKLGLPTAEAADRLAEEHFTHPNPHPAQAA